MTIHTHYHYKGSLPPLSKYDKIKYRLQDEDKEQAEREELAEALSSSDGNIGDCIIWAFKICLAPIVIPIIMIIWIMKIIYSEPVDEYTKKIRKNDELIKKERKEKERKDKEFRIRILKEKYKNDNKEADNKEADMEININNVKNNINIVKDNVNIVKDNISNLKHNLKNIINFYLKHKKIFIFIIFLIGVLIYLPFHEVLINWISPPPPPPEPWFVFWK